MTTTIEQSLPRNYLAIVEATKASGFNMASDQLTCSLLRTLAASKPRGRFLELGTGTGLASAWILDGMDAGSGFVSLDNDAGVLVIAQKLLGDDPRASFVLGDGEAWILANRHQKFDYIFADTWHGKYLMLDEVLEMLNPGGLYIIDDMLPQPNWPDGHAEKAVKLVETLEGRQDLWLTKLNWATGIMIAAKK